MMDPVIPEDERQMIAALKRGQTILFKLPTRDGKGHRHVYQWAKNNKRYVRIDRSARWGNPFDKGKKGSKVDPLLKFAFCSVFNEELRKNLPFLRGKALGCHCPPALCHGTVLIQLLKEAEGKES